MHTPNESHQKTKETLINRRGLKVIRLWLGKSETIPEHSTNADIVVTVVRGHGTFSINGIAIAIKQGDVLDLNPKIPHAIFAEDELELIVVHMHLAEQKAEVSCGTETCAHK